MSEHTIGKLAINETVSGKIKVFSAEIYAKFPTRWSKSWVFAPASQQGRAGMLANARRLIACWNACEELSTEVLESVALGELVFRLRAKPGVK